MRICIDIDGTLCPLRQKDESYADLEPFSGAADRINTLKQQGHYIILQTARHMKTCQSNVGLVVARQGQILIDWLQRHGFIYDELYFGKPYAHVYIDDRALKFQEPWSSVTDSLLETYHY